MTGETKIHTTITSRSRNNRRSLKLLIHDYGGYSFPLELSRELARRGHVVTHVFVNFLATARTNFEKDAGDPGKLSICPIRMSRHYDRRKYNFLLRFWMNFQYAVRLVAEVMRQKPDLILSGNAPTEVQLPLCLLCKARRISFANWVQDFFSVAVKRLLSNKWGFLGAFIGDLYGAADRWIVGRSDISIVISEEFASTIDTWHLAHARYAVIPNWAPVENIPPGAKDNPWAESQGLVSKFVFLYSGTLGLKHNPSLFLELSRQFEGNPDVEIVVVAEGPGAEWLKGETRLEKRANLRILPYQPSEELPDVLATGDVLMAVLENDASQFSVPSKVLTYFCAQRAILLAVPLQNLASQTVMAHSMGLVSEPENSAAFMENALRLYEQKEFRESMGARARRYAEENFKIEVVADKFEKAMGISLAN